MSAARPARVGISGPPAEDALMENARAHVRGSEQFGRHTRQECASTGRREAGTMDASAVQAVAP